MKPVITCDIWAQKLGEGRWAAIADTRDGHCTVRLFTEEREANWCCRQTMVVLKRRWPHAAVKIAQIEGQA